MQPAEPNAAYHGCGRASKHFARTERVLRAPKWRAASRREWFCVFPAAPTARRGQPANKRAVQPPTHALRVFAPRPNVCFSRRSTSCRRQRRGWAPCTSCDGPATRRPTVLTPTAVSPNNKCLMASRAYRPSNGSASKLASRLHVRAATRRDACHASDVTPRTIELP